MTPAYLFQDAVEATIDFVPRLIGAVALLVIGLIVVRLLARLLRRTLARARLDEFGERSGLHDSLARVGFERSVSGFLAALVRVFLGLLVIIVAIGLLGVTSLEEPISEFILFLPRLIVAVAIVLVGVVIAGYVGRWITRLAAQLGVPGPLGVLAEVLVIAIFAIVAFAQAGIPTSIFVVLLAIVLGAAALTVALAFGLGGRPAAGEISAGRYLGERFTPGVRIRVGDMSGVIEALDSAAVMVRADSGDLVRVPNSILLTSPVTFSQVSEPPTAG